MRINTFDRLRASAAIAVAALLAGCGGGGSPAVRATSQPMTGAGQATVVQLSISVPQGMVSGASRGRNYVSPSTAGLIVTVADTSGTSSFGYALSTSATNCTTLSSGILQCTFPIDAHVGSASFSAWLYDAPEGPANGTATAAPTTASGKLLSQKTGVMQSIVIDTANVVALTLSPVVATVSSAAGPQIVSVSGTSGVGGSTAASPPPVFDGIDADSNTIAKYSTAASGAYANAIGVTVADGDLGDTTVSPATLTNATSDAFVATFNGAASVQPKNTTATPYDAIVTATDAFSGGGYGGNASFPTSTATVTVAPLFAYATTYSLVVGGNGISSTLLYGLAAAKPAGTAYKIAATATAGGNDCSNFTLAASSATLTAPEVVAYTVTATAPSASGETCVFALSDGTGTVTDSTPFAATGVIYHPATNADTFAFAGTEVVTYARPNQAPSPEPTTTAAYTIAQTVSVTNPVTFNGNASAVDFKTSETDAQTTGPSTSPIQNVIDTYYGFSNTTSSGNFYTLGFQSIDSNNYAVKVMYQSPGLLTDMLPEASGQTWTNSPAQTIAITNDQGIASTQTYAADGTYTENVSYPSDGNNAAGTPNPGATALLTQNLDGSATYAADRNGNVRTADVVYSFATPNVTANTITITTNTPPLVTASPGATPVATSTTVPNWIPSGYLAKALATETDADSGSATIPATCNVPSSFGTTADKIAQTRNRVDTILGEYEVLTFTYYDVANVGPVCTVLHDVLTSYYDYSGQTYPSYFAGVPQQITTVDEILSLSAEQLDSVARRTAARSAIARAFAMHSSALPARLAILHARRRLEIQRRIAAHVLYRFQSPARQGAH